MILMGCHNLGFLCRSVAFEPVDPGHAGNVKVPTNLVRYGNSRETKTSGKGTKARVGQVGR